MDLQWCIHKSNTILVLKSLECWTYFVFFFSILYLLRSFPVYFIWFNSNVTLSMHAVYQAAKHSVWEPTHILCKSKMVKEISLYVKRKAETLTVLILQVENAILITFCYAFPFQKCGSFLLRFHFSLKFLWLAWLPWEKTERLGQAFS